MRLQIIKAFLPWIIFFAFVNNAVLGLEMGVIGGVLVLLLVNRAALKQRLVLEWVTLGFFVFLLAAGVYWKHPWVVRHSLWVAYGILAIICFGSMLVGKPLALTYAKLEVEEAYWSNPVLIGANSWITLCWGMVFSVASLSVALYAYHVWSNMAWTLQYIPTACLLIAAGFTILFPDIYKAHKARQGGVAAIPGISDVQYCQLSETIRIAYRTVGKGPLLVFIYGYGMNMHYWDPDVLTALATDHQILILDLPGIGCSQDVDMPFEAHTMGCIIGQFLEQKKWKAKAVVGYSLGGAIAQECALQYPDMVQSLVLINANIGGPHAIQTPDTVRAGMQGWFWKDDAFLRYFFSDMVLHRVSAKMQKIIGTADLYGAVRAEHLEKMLHLAKRWYAEDAVYNRLPSVAMPALVMVGMQDMVIPPENAQLLIQRLQHAPLASYDDAGHGLMYQYPLDVADHIREFLHGIEK